MLIDMQYAVLVNVQVSQQPLLLASLPLQTGRPERMLVSPLQVGLSGTWHSRSVCALPSRLHRPMASPSFMQGQNSWLESKLKELALGMHVAQSAVALEISGAFSWQTLDCARRSDSLAKAQSTAQRHDSVHSGLCDSASHFPCWLLAGATMCSTLVTSKSGDGVVDTLATLLSCHAPSELLQHLCRCRALAVHPLELHPMQHDNIQDQPRPSTEPSPTFKQSHCGLFENDVSRGICLCAETRVHTLETVLLHISIDDQSLASTAAHSIVAILCA